MIEDGTQCTDFLWGVGRAFEFLPRVRQNCLRVSCAWPKGILSPYGSANKLSKKLLEHSNALRMQMPVCLLAGEFGATIETPRILHEADNCTRMANAKSARKRRLQQRDWLRRKTASPPRRQTGTQSPAAWVDPKSYAALNLAHTLDASLFL